MGLFFGEHTKSVKVVNCGRVEHDERCRGLQVAGWAKSLSLSLELHQQDAIWFAEVMMTSLFPWLDKMQVLVVDEMDWGFSVIFSASTGSSSLAGLSLMVKEPRCSSLAMLLPVV